MTNFFLEKSVSINAPAAKIWRVFTDPALSRQIGGEYVTDWKEGGTLGWKGLDGRVYTHGTILRVEAERFLQHNILAPAVISVITYELRETHAATLLMAREDFAKALSAEEYRDAESGWDAALMAVKELAERSMPG